MKFIKVTNQPTGTPVYLNVQTIQSMITFEGVNYLKTTASEKPGEIVETPEQVLRMLGAWEDTF
jgi:hypothetical protein